MLQWFDSFNYWTLNSGSPYELNTAATSTAHPRTGPRSLQLAGGGGTNQVRKNLSGNQVTLTSGAAFYLDSTYPTGAGPICPLMAFSDANTLQCLVSVDNLGRFAAYRSNTTLLGTSTASIPLNQYHYVEFQSTLDTGTSGTIVVRLDGSTVLNLSGIRTAAGTNSFANQATWGLTGNTGSAPVVYVADSYCVDSTGGAPLNTFLGDCAVVNEMPNASGSFAQWTPVGSTVNYQNVDEIPANGLTDYNYTTGVGFRDSHLFPSFPPAALVNVGSILGVMVLGNDSTDAAGTRVYALSARQSGVDLFSPNINSGVGFSYHSWITATDVNGGTWTAPNLNATEFGYKLIS